MLVDDMSTELPGESPRVLSKRALIYLGIVLIGANLRAPITSLGPVLPDIQASLALNGTAAGLLNSLPLLIFAVLSLVAPKIGRFGVERVLGWSLVAILVGTLVRSCPFPVALWSGTALLSAGIAFGNVLLPGLVKREFPAQAAALIGLYAASMAGFAGVSAGLALPIAHMPGLDWRWSIAASAPLTLAALAAWTPQWTSKRQHHGAATDRPAPGASPWRHAVGWQISAFFALHSLIFYAIVDWFASYAASAGVRGETAGLYLLLYQVVAVAANLGSAPLIRRWPDQTRLGFACGMLLLIGTTGLLLMPHWSWLWLFSAGLGAGVAMVTSLSLFGLRSRDHYHAAQVSGMAQFIGYLGAAMGPLLVGILHDLFRGWTASLLLLMAASVLVIVFGTLAGRDRIIE